MVLVEDPQGATIRRIALEASSQLAAATAAALPGPTATTVHVSAYTAAMATAPAPTAGATAWPAQQRRQAVAGPLWVSPAPVSVKMRLFCLPYAGGVSENVFAR